MRRDAMTDRPWRRLALELERRRLTVPARLLADAHRPMAPLLSDLGAAVGPLLGVALGGRPERVLSAPHALDELIDELDHAGEER